MGLIKTFMLQRAILIEKKSIKVAKDIDSMDQKHYHIRELKELEIQLMINRIGGYNVIPFGKTLGRREEICELGTPIPYRHLLRLKRAKSYDVFNTIDVKIDNDKYIIIGNVKNDGVHVDFKITQWYHSLSSTIIKKIGIKR